MIRKKLGHFSGYVSLDQGVTNYTPYKKFRPRNFYKVEDEHDKQGWTKQEKEVRRKCHQLKIRKVAGNDRG